MKKSTSETLIFHEVIYFWYEVIYISWAKFSITVYERCRGVSHYFTFWVKMSKSSHLSTFFKTVQKVHLHKKENWNHYNIKKICKLDRDFEKTNNMKKRKFEPTNFLGLSAQNQNLIETLFKWSYLLDVIEILVWKDTFLSMLRNVDKY